MSIEISKNGKRKVILVKKTSGNYFKTKTIYKKGKEYIELDPNRSKIGAAAMLGLKHLPEDNCTVLYLGASAGYTISFIAQFATVFGVEFSPVMARELVFLAEKIGNIAPILGDANQPNQYEHRICEADYLIQDVSQRNQIEIFLKNIKYLAKNGIGVISLKTRNIDIQKKPEEIYKTSLETLKKEIGLKIIQSFPIEKYHKGHYLIVVQKK